MDTVSGKRFRTTLNSSFRKNLANVCMRVIDDKNPCANKSKRALSII
jgi:hypothetical protein